MENNNWETEKKQVIDILSKYVDFTVVPCGKNARTILDVEKRDPMYGGSGVVYMLSLFEKGELVNNRIGTYMVLLNKGDQAGFHEHDSRKEQEIYVIVSGEGKYEEKIGTEGTPRTLNLKKGNVTTTHGEYYHAITNTSDEPLIIFVVTTYQPQ
ncbi:cupin domain-containing protein [Dysgonomonas sp. 216]|uniref:cupin domain-containing protein n=1 Tax=Dysgonomonas sp. 216 TaxID=2302934 RepID=UPI0013D25289|nr:cupin domain-containing protein [Dysgonomonas sp. 216]NDW19266.1 cupin domain-containing protein [Dysgonomonas sp. 216]